MWLSKFTECNSVIWSPRNSERKSSHILDKFQQRICQRKLSFSEAELQKASWTLSERHQRHMFSTSSNLSNNVPCIGFKGVCTSSVCTIHCSLSVMFSSYSNRTDDTTVRDTTSDEYGLEDFFQFFIYFSNMFILFQWALITVNCFYTQHGNIHWP
jgi:hypothetical protein